MTEQFTDDVFIDGQTDDTPLRVQGITGQTAPLQTWEDSTGTARAQINSDGHLQVGDSLATSESLIEAHTDNSEARRGFNSMGRFLSPLQDAISWLFGELQLPGTDTVTGLYRTLHARVTHSNTGDSSAAEVRAGDFEAINQNEGAAASLYRLTGVQSSLINENGASLESGQALRTTVQNGTGTITTARAIHVTSPDNTGTITNLIGLDIDGIAGGANNYAIRTGQGLVRLGDVLEVVEQGTAPSAETGVVRLYAKTDNKLYALDAAGTEYDLMETGQSQPEGVRVYSDVAQTILAADGAVTLSFNQVSDNLDMIYDPAAPDRFTVPATGIYLISAGVALSAVATGEMTLMKAGTDTLKVARFDTQDAVLMHTTVQLQAGEFVQVTLSASVDVDVLARTATDGNNFFALTRHGSI